MNTATYDAAFLSMIALLLISTLLWFRVDPTYDVIAEAE